MNTWMENISLISFFELYIQFMSFLSSLFKFLRDVNGERAQGRSLQNTSEGEPML